MNHAENLENARPACILTKDIKYPRQRPANVDQQGSAPIPVACSARNSRHTWHSGASETKAKGLFAEDATMWQFWVPHLSTQPVNPETLEAAVSPYVSRRVRDPRVLYKSRRAHAKHAPGLLRNCSFGCGLFNGCCL